MRRVLTASRVRLASAVVLTVIVFFAHLFAQIVALRILVIAVGALVLLGELALSGLSRRRMLVTALSAALYLAAAIAVTELIAHLLGDRLFAVNAQHLFIMLPMFATLGWVVYRTGAWRVYVPVMLAVGGVTAVLATAEWLLGVSVVGRGYEFLTSQREGTTRALVGAENSLVLGALLAALVPLTLVLRRMRLQIGVAVLLIIGVWASGSRAPAAVCAAVAVVQFVPLFRRLLQRFVWAVQLLAGAVVVGLAWFATVVWQTYIPGATGLEYSSNYRGALYAIVPELLLEQPFGYLLRSAPAGRWMVDSELHGRFDITRSLDSEVVFAAFGLGWVGLALFLASLFLALATIRRSVALGLSASTLTALGFVLALHGWDGMSVLWYALIGACLACVIGDRMRTRRRAVPLEPPSAPPAPVGE